MITDRQRNKIKKLANLKYGPKDIALVTGLGYKRVQLELDRLGTKPPKQTRVNGPKQLNPSEDDLQRHAAEMIASGFDPAVVKANFG